MIKMLEHKKNETHKGGAREALRDELRIVRKQLESLDSCFNIVEDGAVLEAIIMQRGKLEERYGSLLRMAKEQDVVEQPPHLTVLR